MPHLRTVEPAGLTIFDDTTRVRPTGLPGEMAAELSPVWSSLIGILGGSLVSIAVRAIEAYVPDRAVRTVGTTFARVGRPGPAHVQVDVTHSSRSVTSAAARITQDGRLLATTRATLVAPRAGVEWSAPTRLLTTPLEECVPIEPPDPRPPHFEQIDGVLDPSSLPFTGGPRAVVRGYVRPLEPRPIDAAWLAMAVDCFPPPAFVRVGPPTGGVSVDLVTHIHRTLPVDGDRWLTAAFEIDDSAGALAVEHGRIATTDGTLLAESFHTRWTATDTAGSA